MAPAMRNTLWLAFVAVVAVIAFVAGYRQGGVYGATVATELHVRGDAAERIGDIKQALDAMERGDAELSRRLQEQTVRGALITLGSFNVSAGAVADICTDSARRTLADARQYLLAHPPAGDDAMAELVRRGGDFCR